VKNLILIIGGARSGKSKLAEELANKSGLSVHYLATMPFVGSDAEQVQRIERHRQRRPASWTTIENADLKQAISLLPAGPSTAIIDCLSLHVSNLLLAGEGSQSGLLADSPFALEETIAADVEAVLSAIDRRSDWTFFVVTNEVGAGVVPETPLGRAFRDFLGLANQRFAQSADTVWLTYAGLQLKLKSQTADGLMAST
jgi:adenosylcobinamide kinase/adenosylcobinamide-phosphate guanylyltransferase